MPDTPLSTAATVLDLARSGRFAELRELFPPPLRDMVSADSLQAAWDTEIVRTGPVVEIGTPLVESDAHGTLVKIPITCERGGLTAIIQASESGALLGIQLAPLAATEPGQEWQPPSYAVLDAFDEQEVTVGDGPLAVGGTLSLPRIPGQHPGIVLLAGSGPQDRDETIGRNKILKDLAWGLASRGVAVLRFDKVTYAHGREIATRDFTLVDEYVPHALSAVELLRDHHAVDAGRIFLAGHSLGGTVAPRVAASEPIIAGIVLLAGGVAPLHWSAVRQATYLASLDPNLAATYQPMIETFTRQAIAIDKLDASSNTPASELPFGTPASYWLDLRGYDPVATAASLGKPMLILQGGRDYQVTVADELSRWRDGLAASPDVTIRIYDADDHMFFPGSGPSTPAKYEPAQHMDREVITDIANWLTASQRG
ncbi:MAG TPA: alpha/beta fold hydrolase [Nitrolancea sp.]|nr:alpha/beta fold hydrolase [Nitrolancea sp.]